MLWTMEASKSKWLRTAALHRKEQSEYSIQKSVSKEVRKSYAFGKTGEKIIIV